MRTGRRCFKGRRRTRSGDQGKAQQGELNADGVDLTMVRWVYNDERATAEPEPGQKPKWRRFRRRRTQFLENTKLLTYCKSGGKTRAVSGRAGGAVLAGAKDAIKPLTMARCFTLASGIGTPSQSRERLLWL